MATFFAKLCRVCLGVLIFSVVCSVVTKLIVFPNREMTIYPYPSSMRRVESRCWLFCERLIVSTGADPTRRFRACLYNKEPSVSQNIDTDNFSEYVTISNVQMKTWAYFLNTGSDFQIHIENQFRYVLNVAVIKGEQNYSAWNYESYDERFLHYVENDIPCWLGMCHFRYPITGSDDVYFFILQAQSAGYHEFNTRVTISSRTVNTSGARCLDSLEGRSEFDLFLHPMFIVGVSVLDHGYDPTGSRDTFDVRVTWESRVWVYVVVFGVVPLMFVTLVALLIRCVQLSVRRLGHQPLDDDTEEDEALLGVEPPPYSSVRPESSPALDPTRPPSYSDVISSQQSPSVNNDPPPPYIDRTTDRS